MEEAFFELLETTHYTKISVSDLIKKAGVSRTTFYRHYTDILDMYEKVCEHLVSAAIYLCISRFMPAITDGQEVLSDDFWKAIEPFKEKAKILCGHNAGRRFFEIALDMIEKLFTGPHCVFDDSARFIVKFLTFAGIGTLVSHYLNIEDLPNDFLVITAEIFTMANETRNNNGQCN